MKTSTEGTRACQLEEALEADHFELEARFRQALSALRRGDSGDVRARWLALERALGAHMRAEEQHVLPAFEKRFPHDAARIRREHQEIRRSLEQLGVELDLHALREQAASDFLDLLGEHAAHEQSVLYAWAQVQLSEHDRRSVLGRLRALA